MNLNDTAMKISISMLDKQVRVELDNVEHIIGSSISIQDWTQIGMLVDNDSVQLF